MTSPFLHRSMNRPPSQYSPGWRDSRRFLERLEDGSAVGLGTLTGTGHVLNPAGTFFQHVMVVRLSSCSPKDGPEYADRELNPVRSYFQRVIAA
jgi:hypothetical protein